MWQFLLSSWRAGIRSRSIQGILILGVLLVGVAYLSASFSPRQPKTVALDVGLSGLRLSLILLALFWVQELVGREVERRTVLFSLTYPVARGYYIIARYLGILLLLAAAATLLSLLLWGVVYTAGGDYEQSFSVTLGFPYFWTVFGLWVDAALVAAFSLWLTSFSTVPLLPLALGLAFAIAGKALGAVVDYLAKGADGDAGTMKLAPAIDLIQWVLPDLSRLDWRVWPMYGVNLEFSSMLIALCVAASYIGMLLSFTVITFRRRDFV